MENLQTALCRKLGTEKKAANTNTFLKQEHIWRKLKRDKNRARRRRKNPIAKQGDPLVHKPTSRSNKIPSAALERLVAQGSHRSWDSAQKKWICDVATPNK